MCTGREFAARQCLAPLQQAGVRVRPAQLSDGSVLIRLTRQLAAEHGETAERLTEEVLASVLWGPRPLLSALVAEAHDGVAGSVLYSVGYSTFSAQPRIWIEDVIVSLHHRRLGIGSALMDALRSRAAELGAVEMYGLVSDSNPRAHAFWREMGAQDKTGWWILNVSVDGEPR